MPKSNLKPTKAAALALVQAIIAGTQKHTPSGSLTFGGATYTVSSLLQLFESRSFNFYLLVGENADGHAIPILKAEHMVIHTYK